MPSGGAGLIRFFEDETPGIKVGPTVVVAIQHVSGPFSLLPMEVPQSLLQLAPALLYHHWVLLEPFHTSDISPLWMHVQK